MLILSAVLLPACLADEAPLPANATMDQVLDALDQRGKTLQSFSADLSDTTGDPALGNEQTRTGMIWFQHRGEGNDRIRVLFDKLIIGRIAQAQKHEYLLEGPWLIDRNYDQKVEVKRQVLKPGEKINLLKLGEGPFPLPIGQDKQKVKELFDVTMPDPAKDDPPNTIHVSLVPRQGTELANKFTSIDVWVDRTLRMPVVIETLDAAGSAQHRTELKNLHLNPPGGLSDKDFSLPPIDDKNWNLQTDTYGS